MASYTKSVTFSSTELNSSTTLNITDLTIDESLQSISLVSSLVLGRDSPNSVSFTVSDGSTNLGSAAFNVILDAFNLNASDFTISSSYNSYDIAYGNGKYVLALYNTKYFAYSTDGNSFSTGTVYSTYGGRYTDTVYPVSIIYGNNRFIMHSGQYMYHSSDGSKWTRVSVAGFGAYNYRASFSLYGNGIFVLSLVNQPYIYYSTTGTSWTSVSVTAATYTGAAYGAEKFVYITADGTTYYSSNGSSWSTGSIGNGSNWNTLCYGNDRFVAISTDGSVAISTDGLSWTYYSGKLTAKTWISVEYGNGMFVAIANNSNVLAASFDGITWYETTIEESNRAWNKVRFANNIFWGLANSSSSGKKFNPELLFKLDPTENTISTNNHTIKNSSLTVTRSEIPTVNSGELGVTLTLEKNETFTLTQKYYIDGTTTSIKDADVTNVEKGSSWAFSDYPSKITIGDDEYVFSSVSGDNASGTNITSNKERIIYYTYVLKTFTLTQKYYIKGTTTSLKSDTVTSVTEGDSWAFGSYPSKITIGDDEYVFSSVSGDNASGTNINSNKERIIYYTYVLKTFTLTQNYYINGTTTALQDSTVTSVTEGNNWSFGDYPSKITIGDDEYVFSSVSGDDASGTNINSNKVRNVYYTYVLKTFTLTQKYYIKGTTTSLKSDTITSVTEGNNWSFSDYPSTITVGDDEYVFSSVSGDNASGTNLDGNKERIVYYTYVLKTFTLTQKYYIKGTTTSLQSDTVINVTEGNNWAFGSYPSTITVGNDTYAFDSISGDDASGTNINSNKVRNVYYTYVPKVYTLTQKYYIDGTTTALQDSTVTSVTEGNNWAFGSYPSKITIGDDEYVFSSVSGDESSGTNLDGNKERIIYYTYVLKTFTLTQKYYIKGTTTSLKSDTITSVTEGNSWAFGSYPSKITIGDDEYVFSSVSGDDASGTNINSNKERIIYYTYVLKTFTLTQKYYIKGTTTPIQDSTITTVTEGNNWAFGSYPSKITIGDDEYVFSSVSGDESSGTNLDGNKERIVYYTYVPKVYTLTQKYYIKGTTTALQDSTVTSVTEGNNWAFGDYPTNIIIGDNTYAFDSVSGDDASGTNINSNKERIVYYICTVKKYTISQKYYIKDTVTSIKATMFEVLVEGSSWQFESYPENITYNGNTYIFDSITGDNASGTNIDSNKERIVYYTLDDTYMRALMMSDLYNDTNMCYIREYFLDYNVLNENSTIILSNLINTHKIYKIKIIYKNIIDNLIEFNIANIKFIANGAFTIESVDTNITIMNNCVILTHSNTTMSSGSIEIHLYCKP